MDTQLKRGLLDVCVLAAIESEDSYCYKMIKDMKPYIELSGSTLYTILKRLETADMLTVRTAEHGGRREIRTGDCLDCPGKRLLFQHWIVICQCFFAFKRYFARKIFRIPIFKKTGK